MRGRTESCETVRQEIAALRAGWLSPGRAAAVERHLGECEGCAAVARLDSRIVAGLAEAPCAAPAPVTWAEVQARHGAGRPPRRRPVRRALAACAAAAALALLAMRLHTPPRPSPAPGLPGDEPAGDAGAFIAAHYVGSPGEMPADPNSALLLTMARANRVVR